MRSCGGPSFERIETGEVIDGWAHVVEAGHPTRVRLFVRRVSPGDGWQEALRTVCTHLPFVAGPPASVEAPWQEILTETLVVPSEAAG